MTRPVVRLELGGRPVWFTRILPESRSTSLLIRCVRAGGGAKEEGKDSRVEVVVRLELGCGPVVFTRILPESCSTSLLIRSREGVMMTHDQAARDGSEGSSGEGRRRRGGQNGYARCLRHFDSNFKALAPMCCTFVCTAARTVAGVARP